MKKLILLTAALATISTAASAYSTQGVTVENGDCNVYSNPNQDRHYWIPKLALREFTVADSIDYHEARTNGNNFNAAALCWMNDRGLASVFMDNGGDNNTNWFDLGMGESAITSMSYDEKLDIARNGVVVAFPTNFLSTVAASLGSSAETEVQTAWIELNKQEWAHDYFLQQFKAGWESAEFTPAVEGQEAIEASVTLPTLPAVIADRPTVNNSDYSSIQDAIDVISISGYTLRDNNFKLSYNGTVLGYAYYSGTDTAVADWGGTYTTGGEWTAAPAIVVEGQEAIAATPAMYGGYTLTAWTNSLLESE